MCSSDLFPSHDNFGRGTPFLYIPSVELAPVLLDLLKPRYLYRADDEMFVFASVAIPYVFAYIIGNLMSFIFIPIPVRLLCNQLLYSRNPPKNRKCCSLNDPNSGPSVGWLSVLLIKFNVENVTFLTYDFHEWHEHSAAHIVTGKQLGRAHV